MLGEQLTPIAKTGKFGLESQCIDLKSLIYEQVYSTGSIPAIAKSINYVPVSDCLCAGLQTQISRLDSGPGLQYFEKVEPL